MTDIRHFIADDGARPAFRDEGRDLPLFCLPGLTRSMADLDYPIPHLPPLRLVRMDCRGRGASDWTGAGTYTVAQEAKDSQALLNHLGVAGAAMRCACRSAPDSRACRDEARKLARETPDGLRILDHLALREAFLSAIGGAPLDFRPQFDALRDLPLALIRALLGGLR